MNETIFTPRQKYILNLINQSEGFLREEIQEKIGELYPVSKPTLIRDLNALLKSGLIKVIGKAKSTKYLATANNPLLRRFDLNRYFVDEADKRVVSLKTFNFKIFDQLNNLFLPNELKALNDQCKGFEERTSQLTPDIFKRELERFIIELSWKSSKIEGNTYTLLETETLIKEQMEAQGRRRDEAIMILNHKYAFEEILQKRNQFRRISLSYINQLHNILVKDLEITAGIRKQAVGITGTVYKPLDNEHQIKEVFEKTISAVNKTENVFEKALIVHFMVPYIQPYSDGNKRTARMLINAILLAHNLYPISYRSVDEDEFKKALILFYEQNSIYHLKGLFIDQLFFAYNNYFR